MVSISLFVELLRSRPGLLFWTMAALQAALWTVVPALFYSAPPGDLPLVLAIGHEFQFGSEFGPPLAFWLAEIAYRSAGISGVYLLSQVCIIAAFWAVMALGRAIVGGTHAVMAVLLMTGVAVFSVPTPEFGPAILATPLWAFILYHYWKALGGGSIYWVAVGIEAGLLLLTTYSGLIFIGLIVLYTLSSAPGRAQVQTIGPWIAGIALVAVLFPYLIWLDLSVGISFLDLATIVRNLQSWTQLLLALLISHIGMGLLILLGRSPWIATAGPSPIVSRPAADPRGRAYIYFFALSPILGMGLFALFSRRPENFLAAPLVIMSGLAVIAFAGDRIRIERQYLIGYAWIALLVLPPLLVAAAIVVQPWTFALDLRVGRPAAEMGEFFGDSFARRTGAPLAVVSGDVSLATLIALGAPSRPSLYLDSAPEDLPRVTRQDIADKGAVIVWPAKDSAGRPPPEIVQQFPGLVTEVPRAFSRQYQGRMPLMRVGWGMIRPHAERNVTVPVQAPPPEPEPPQPVIQPPPRAVQPLPLPQSRPAQPAPPPPATQPPLPEAAPHPPDQGIQNPPQQPQRPRRPRYPSPQLHAPQ